jgi:hypothetical protein
MIQIGLFNTSKINDLFDISVEFLNLVSADDACTYSAPLLLGLDESHLMAIKQIIMNRQLPVIVVIKSKGDFKFVSELKMFYSKIFGFIDLTTDQELAVPMLKSYLNINFTKKALSLDKLSNELDQVHERTQTELRGIKALHDRFVKIRSEKIKGAELLIKFMAGERSGGEFFDYTTHESQMLFLQAGSDSYIMSSLIISAMEDWKVKHNDFYGTVNSFISGLNHHAKEHNAKLSYTIMIVNLKNMEATIFGQGQSRLFYNNDIMTNSKNYTVKLKRGDKVTFLSEGTFINWEKCFGNISIKDFLIKNIAMNNRDFINELFFELARTKKGTFLENDALVAMLEINENILYKL